MPIANISQPSMIPIDSSLRLKMYSSEKVRSALPWYQDPEILYYSEGLTEGVYDLKTVERMYQYLTESGELYFIETFEEGMWTPIGDVTLALENFPIIIGEKKYWGQGIGRKVVGILLKRAEEIGLEKIYIPTIYKYNLRSKNLFTSFGFVKVDEDDEKESFELVLKKKK